VLANELKGDEQIKIRGRIGSQFNESSGVPRIVFLYNAKTDETRNLLLPGMRQNLASISASSNIIVYFPTASSKRHIPSMQMQNVCDIYAKI
jgi:hypothetical protein